MVEDKGIEPGKEPERSEYSEGQNQHKAGQNQEVASENQTELERTRTPKEPAKTITEYITDLDLKAVVDAWPHLSEKTRQEVVALISRGEET